MWDLIVSVPNHCLSFDFACYYTIRLTSNALGPIQTICFADLQNAAQ